MMSEQRKPYVTLADLRDSRPILLRRDEVRRDVNAYEFALREVKRRGTTVELADDVEFDRAMGIDPPAVGRPPQVDADSCVLINGRRVLPIVYSSARDFQRYAAENDLAMGLGVELLIVPDGFYATPLPPDAV